MGMLDTLRNAGPITSGKRDSVESQLVLKSAVLSAVWKTWSQFTELPRDFDPITAVMDRLDVAHLARHLRLTEGSIIDACLSLLVELEIQSRRSAASQRAAPALSPVQ